MIPPKSKNFIKVVAHLTHQKHMASVRANAASVNNIIRHSSARQVDEVGPEAAMAIEKILKQPT